MKLSGWVYLGWPDTFSTELLSSLSHTYVVISSQKNTNRHPNAFSASSFVHSITLSLELPTGKVKHNAETTGFLARCC